MTMGEAKEDICRLCLKSEGDTFSPLNESSKENLKVIVPELNLDSAADLVICSKCKVSLEESCQLKKTCTETDQFIRAQLKKENITDKVKLNRIVSKSSDTENICRVCLKNKEVNYKSISSAKTDDLFTAALEKCLQELDVELTADPVICEACHNTLRDMYSFKTACLSVEDKLKHYRETTSESEIDLRKVLDFLKSEPKKSLGEDNFLSEFEVQDEEEADIFDIFPNFSGEGGTASENNETNKKRPTTDEPSNEAAKKPKKEVPEDELPPFHFNFNLIFNPQTEGTMEEWLVKVEEVKTKLGWSDYITIHKVLVKLKGMEDLYTWFSSISEIMTWDEWKKKLVQMFPIQNDFYIKLKRMFNRKKKPAETYVHYYEAKLKLMEGLNLSPDKVVSCLIGGVTDIAVGCIARVGNYKTPEELLEYFKSCNDKKPAVSAPVKNDKPKDKPADAVKAAPQTNAGNKVDKKKRLRCLSCLKYGHATKECWGNSKTVPNGAAGKGASNTPNAAQKPRARPKAKRRCLHCGKLGHAPQQCPRPASLLPAAKALRFIASRGGRFANAMDMIPASKAQGQLQKKKKANPQTSRCRNCGKFGHLERNCRGSAPSGGYSNRAPSGGRSDDRYFGRDMMMDRLGEESSRIVCFKCFRVGHDARDCVEYGGRAFRN